MAIHHCCRATWITPQCFIQCNIHRSQSLSSQTFLPLLILKYVTKWIAKEERKSGSAGGPSMKGSWNRAGLELCLWRRNVLRLGKNKLWLGSCFVIWATQGEDCGVNTWEDLHLHSFLHSYIYICICIHVKCSSRLPKSVCDYNCSIPISVQISLFFCECKIFHIHRLIWGRKLQTPPTPLQQNATHPTGTIQFQA